MSEERGYEALDCKLFDRLVEEYEEHPKDDGYTYFSQYARDIFYNIGGFPANKSRKRSAFAPALAEELGGSFVGLLEARGLGLGGGLLAWVWAAYVLVLGFVVGAHRALFYGYKDKANWRSGCAELRGGGVRLVGEGP